LKDANDNLASTKGGKEIAKAKEARAKATQEVKRHAKAIDQLVNRIKKQPFNWVGR